LAVPDVNKTLPVLRAQWEQCQNCALGVRRAQVGGSFVFGEGVPGGVLFIGEGPGKDEEINGRPFVGNSGQVLRDTLKDHGMEHIAYITNCVSCRSCAQAYDSEGHPRVNDRGQPIIKDQEPTPEQVLQCSPRLYEEIYMVDPVLIVTLGRSSAEFLLHRSVKITSEVGGMHVVKIPGATHRPVLTEKRQQWLRKVRGEWVMPTEQNTVEYACILNLHPAYVLRNIGDERPGNPTEKFIETMKFARRVYDQYVAEVFSQAQEA
jgi:uracil-DNA glycosylase family 4